MFMQTGHILAQVCGFCVWFVFCKEGWPPLAATGRPMQPPGPPGHAGVDLSAPGCFAEAGGPPFLREEPLSRV